MKKLATLTEPLSVHDFFRTFTIQVWYDDRWVDGKTTYDTLEAAEKRLVRLDEVGIVARIKPATDE